MADDQTPDQTPVKRKRGKPWGYLVFAALILGIFLAMVLKPDLPRSLFGGDSPKPDSLGDSPAMAGNVSGGDLGERDLAAAMADLGTINVSKSPPPAAIKQPDDAPTKPVVVDASDEPKAAQLLADAETAYQAMDWDRAESLARGIAKLAAKPATRDRAAEIERRAPGLKRVFKELDERDELTRNFETNPSLVRLVKGGAETLAVPITQMEAPYNAVVDNPVGWIQAQRKVGKVMLLIKGSKQFTPAEMAVEDYDIQPADLSATRAEAQQTLSSRAARVAADKTVRRDAFVWYELGKFAYRNRLDDQVARYLDVAVDLDPDLARNVREANAGILFGSLVMHAKNGNKQQAAAFMASIERRYKDTDQANRARLFYEGKQTELIAAAREAERKQREVAEARLAAKIAAAKKKGDEEQARAIRREADEIDEQPALPEGPVDASIASARKLSDQGAALLREATNMPATDARNHKYGEAANLLGQAKALYGKFLDKNPNDTAAQGEMVETSQMLFTAKKMKTL